MSASFSPVCPDASSASTEPVVEGERSVRPELASAIAVARAALDASDVGEHLGVTPEGDVAATHRFAAAMPGYRGWQWAVVVASAPGSDHVTVSELALLPGPDALVAPQWVPWNERIRPGDLGPGDRLAPLVDDDRLVPGYRLSGDSAVDEVGVEIGLGRRWLLSEVGRTEAAQRWHDGEFGPDSEMARAAESTCDTCGFFLPVAGALGPAFGVCANEFAADGHVVYADYGCGAHSDTTLPTGSGSPAYDAYDDGAVEVVVVERRAEPESAVSEAVVSEAGAPETDAPESDAPAGDDAPA